MSKRFSSVFKVALCCFSELSFWSVVSVCGMFHRAIVISLYQWFFSFECSRMPNTMFRWIDSNYTWPIYSSFLYTQLEYHQTIFICMSRKQIANINSISCEALYIAPLTFGIDPIELSPIFQFLNTLLINQRFPVCLKLLDIKLHWILTFYHMFYIHIKVSQISWPLYSILQPQLHTCVHQTVVPSTYNCSDYRQHIYSMSHLELHLWILLFLRDH